MVAISNFETLHRHDKWAIVVISETASPLDRALWIARISTRPKTKFNVAWGLWILAWREVRLSSDSLPIQNPFDLILGPVDCVVVHSTHCTAVPIDSRIFAVELARIALAIEVV